MKKLLSIALLLIILLQSGGALFLCGMKQYAIRQNAKSLLNNSDTHFQKITLSASAYQKAKINNQELSYRGHLYDVKSVKTTEKGIELLVINDSEEENILHYITILFKKTKEPTKDVLSSWSLLSMLNYLPPKPTSIVFLHFKNTTTFQKTCPVLDVNYFDTSTPPPKTVS